MSFVGFLRDSAGNVKFDDWNNIPQIFHPHLTAADWQWIAQKVAEQA